MSTAIQNIIVTLAAVGAAAVFVRRLIGSRNAATKPSCPSCESGAPCAPGPAVKPDVKPLTLVLSSSKGAKVQKS